MRHLIAILWALVLGALVLALVVLSARAEDFAERFVFASVDQDSSWTTNANPVFGYVPQAKLPEVTVTAPQHRTRHGQRTTRGSSAGTPSDVFGRMAVSQGLTLGLAAANVPYAGSVVCTGMSFNTMVQEGIRDGENWTAFETAGNVGLSAANCFLHLNSIVNARSPGESILRVGDLVASYLTPYGIVPYIVRDKIITQVTQPLTPAHTARAQRVHRQVATGGGNKVVKKSVKKRSASQSREQII